MQHQQPSSEMVRLLRIAAGDVDYMLELAHVGAIEDSSPVAKAAWAGRSVVDIEFRGRTLPTAKLTQRLAPTSSTHFFSRPNRTYLVVIAAGELSWAMVVDKVSAETIVPRSWIKPLPSVCGNPRTTPFNGVLVRAAERDGESPAGRMTLVIDPLRLHPDVGLLSEPPTPVRTTPLIQHPAPIPRGGRFQMINVVASGRLGRDDETFIGLSFAQVLEIIDPTHLLETPFAPNFVKGLTLWRDQVTPIIDLAQRLKMPPLAAERVRWAVARATPTGDPIGFPIRPGVDVVRLPTPHRPSSLAYDSNLILGAFQLDDRTVVVPDLAVASYCR